MSWEDLNYKQRAELAKIYIKNGITAIDDMKAHYNAEGGLLDGPEDKTNTQQWVLDGVVYDNFNDYINAVKVKEFQRTLWNDSSPQRITLPQVVVPNYSGIEVPAVSNKTYIGEQRATDQVLKNRRQAAVSAQQYNNRQNASVNSNLAMTPASTSNATTHAAKAVGKAIAHDVTHPLDAITREIDEARYFVPGISSIMMAKDANTALNNGDYGSAFLNGAFALSGSFIPEIGKIKIKGTPIIKDEDFYRQFAERTNNAVIKDAFNLFNYKLISRKELMRKLNSEYLNYSNNRMPMEMRDFMQSDKSPLYRDIGPNKYFGDDFFTDVVEDPLTGYRLFMGDHQLVFNEKTGKFEYNTDANYSTTRLRNPTEKDKVEKDKIEVVSPLLEDPFLFFDEANKADYRINGLDRVKEQMKPFVPIARGLARTPIGRRFTESMMRITGNGKGPTKSKMKEAVKDNLPYILFGVGRAKGDYSGVLTPNHRFMPSFEGDLIDAYFGRPLSPELGTLLADQNYLMHDNYIKKYYGDRYGKVKVYQVGKTGYYGSKSQGIEGDIHAANDYFLDVAGHKYYVGPDNIAFEQDIWKYNPDQYIKKWWKDDIEGNFWLPNAPKPWVGYLGLHMFDAAGTPVITRTIPKKLDLDKVGLDFNPDIDINLDPFLDPVFDPNLDFDPDICLPFY